MLKSILHRRSKKVVEGSLAATIVAGTVLGNTLTAQADGSSSAGSGGGGTSNSSRAQDSGQLGSAASSISGGSTSSTGRNSDGQSRSSGGSGGSGGSSASAGGFDYGSYSYQNVTKAEFQAIAIANGVTDFNEDGTYGTGPGGSWASFSPNSDGSGGSYSGSSTPFLSIWNGKKYEFDNDFLFGKPETSFDNFAEGLAAYKAGKVGSDAYFLKNKLKPENGTLKFQIKEIEPEESFIDSFRLTAVDMPRHFYPVTDGNLRDVYIFDTTAVKTLENQKATLQAAKTQKVSTMQNGYDRLGPTQVGGHDAVLEAGDSIVIRLPIASQSEEDTFLLVDSYFRDWALGNQVPFSTAEMFWLKTIKITRVVPTLLLALSMALFGLFTKETNADIPRGGGGSGGGGGGFTSRNRSLVITAKVGDEVVYLQTLFPRYVQASQEMVKIPTELLKKAVGSVIEICITATKKHKVRSAFIFAGKPTDEEITYTELETVSAVKLNTNTDYASVLSQKNGDFLHTVPADVINIEIKDAPRKDGHDRYYLLKADGFYTKMSKRTKDLMGDKWYARLDSDSKKLLRNLRVYKS